MKTNKHGFFHFEKFDPLKGELPDYLSHNGNKAIDNARLILKDRTTEEIYAGQEIIAYLLTSDYMQKYRWNELDEKYINNIKQEEKPTYSCSFAEDLLICMKELDVSDYDEFKDATWSELFAVLALGLIADAMENFTVHQMHPHEAMKETFSYESIGDGIIEATECIAIAIGLNKYDNTLEELKMQALQKEKKKQSLQGLKGAIKRHSPVNELKRECYEYFISHNDKDIKKREAASEYYEALPNERKRLLAPTNAIRTLAEGITQLEKEHQSTK